MKKLLILLFGVLVGLPALSQTDTIHVYKEGDQYKADIKFPIEIYPTTVIVDSTNFWKPDGVPPDSIPPDPGPDPEPHFDFICSTEAEIISAAQQALPGDTIAIRSGTYRITITPSNSDVKFFNYPGEIAIISGFNLLTTPWVVHSGNIYKTSVVLPVNGFNTSMARVNEAALNTTIFANQILQNGDMMIEARWPNVNQFADLLDRSKYKNGVDYTNGLNKDNIVDAALTGLPNLNGGTVIINGWFNQFSGTISSHSGNKFNYSLNCWDDSNTGRWTRVRYYVTGKLALLDAAKEFHYENGVLYFYQPGGGLPSGKIEYKARNHGFDIRNKANITIKGIHFIGCEPAVGNISSPNAVLDGIRAKYQNHHVRHDVVEWQGVGMSKQFGIKLLGANSIIKNSDLSFYGSSGVWLGPGCQAINNYMHDSGYVGLWANPVSLWGTDDNQKILHNTIFRTGRSSFDFGYNFGKAPGTSKHYNVEVAYNDFSQACLISSDGGATYVWGQCDLSGLNYHHNWIHDIKQREQADGGVNVGIYLDQATGPGKIHHNITWNCADADLYHETTNDWRPVQGTWTHPDTRLDIYNNTFYTPSPAVSSYRTYVTSTLDVQKNNIYRLPIVVKWQPGNNGNTSNSILNPTDPLLVGGDIQKPQSYFQLQSNSPARNIGLTTYAGATGTISDGDRNAGAYTDDIWVAGYNWTDTENNTHVESGDPREQKTGTWEYFANAPWMTPGMFSNQDYNYTQTMGATLKIPFTGSGIKWYSERRENHGVVEIRIDGALLQTLDLYYNTQKNGKWLAFEKLDLANGSHTIDIKLVGKNSLSVGTPGFLNDYFDIIIPPTP